MLAKMRESHLLERQEAYMAKDWQSYIDIVTKQQSKEIKLYNKVTLEVLDEAGIKSSVFNQSV